MVKIEVDSAKILVSSAARSPGRSSTGPEVWRRLTPSSAAMMCDFLGEDAAADRIRSAVEATDAEFPIRLTTGRRLESYNTGVQTEKFTSPLHHGEFLELILQDELNVRQQRKITRRTVAAEFTAQTGKAVTIDPGVYEALRAYCNKKCGVILGHGIGDLSGKAFRIAHMGHVNAPVVLGTLGAVEMALNALAIPYRKGGAQAAVDFLGTEVRA